MEVKAACYGVTSSLVYEASWGNFYVVEWHEVNLFNQYLGMCTDCPDLDFPPPDPHR